MSLQNQYGCEGLEDGLYFSLSSTCRAWALLGAENMLLLSEKGKKYVLLNAGATPKYSSVKTHALAIMGCIYEDFNKFCLCQSYHLDSCIMHT